MSKPSKVFPVPYQIDFTAESKGRHLDSTKRKITWKFGFAHPPAIFPHLFDKDENYIGENGNPSNDDTPHKKGTECRGREHEIILVWSILTNKAHIYVNSQEIFRLDSPHEDYINLNPFSGSFRRGFNLPNAKYNGKHRIDIRCYARTPMGAKNMIVDDAGGKFRQYELTIDGLSFFSMPAMYELGTQKMWHKLSRWRMVSESQEQDTQGERQHYSGNNNQTGRLQDEYYFSQNKGKPDRSITKSERRAMAPRTESDEQRMTRIAMEASLRDIENENHARSHDKGITLRSSSHEENNVVSGNRQSSSHRLRPENKNTSLVTVGEDDNLIDFGDDDTPVGVLANGVSQISFSRQTTSDVSVLADDDDKTTASFMMKPGWNNSAGQQPTMPMGTMYSQQTPQQANVQSQYRDPTFAPPQRPWNNVGNISSNPMMNTRPGLSSEMSFAVPPAPTLDDFKDAFGSSTMSMAASNPMSPASTIGMYSPTAPRGNWQNQPTRAGPPASQPAPTQFDPLRSDPFASY